MSSQPLASGTLSVEIQLDPKLLPEHSTTSSTTPSSSTTVTTTTSSSTSSSFSSSRLTSFTVPLPVNVFSPVCELKRHIALRTGIPPQLQRLSLQGSTDSFRFPSTVLLTKRAARHELYSVTVQTYNETDPNCRWTVQVDPNDTVLDLKFLLQPLVKADADYQQLYVWRKGDRSRSACLDSSTLMAAGVLPNTHLRILFEYPSTQPGHGSIHRSEVHLTQFRDPSTPTIGHMFRAAAARFPSRHFFGTREWKADGSRGAYQWQTFGDVDKRVTAFGSGLVHLGLRRKDTVGIIAVNRSEWTLTDVTCAVQGLVSVPLYDTLGPDAVKFIINHSQVKAVVCAKAQLPHIVAVRAQCPSLQLIILMDDQLVDQQFVAGGGSGFTHTVSQVEKIGSAHPYPDHLPNPEDMYTLSYTSGTTGQPKGAILSHRSMVSATQAVGTRLVPEVATDHEVYFSYLPQAHIYERIIDMGAVDRGNGLGFYSGDLTKLVEDVAELKPTAFPGVPRVWQRMYDRVNAQVASSNFISRSLFERGLASKQAQLASGSSEPTLWDRLVFSKTSARFGGNLKIIVSGAAPISPTVAEYVRIAFQAPMLEGYGLTETCATMTLTPFDGLANGRSVGIVVPCNEVKLVDVPDMGYLTTDQPQPRGEIWVRGFNVFSGYYQLPEVTAEVLTADGWFMTGDVGTWLPDGSLKIIDRKKNLFKLSQGEYIRPEHIEGVYKQSKSAQRPPHTQHSLTVCSPDPCVLTTVCRLCCCRYVGSIYVHGDSEQNYLVAVVVPNWETVGVGASKAAIIKDPKILRQIQQSMEEVAKHEGLKGFEQVRRVLLVDEEWTVENGLMTPTQKLKRNAVAKRFEAEIKALYSKVEKTAEKIKAKL